MLQNDNISMDSYIDLSSNKSYNSIPKITPTSPPEIIKPKVNNGWNSCLYINNFMPTEDDLINLWLK